MANFVHDPAVVAKQFCNLICPSFSPSVRNAMWEMWILIIELDWLVQTNFQPISRFIKGLGIRKYPNKKLYIWHFTPKMWIFTHPPSPQKHLEGVNNILHFPILYGKIKIFLLPKKKWNLLIYFLYGFIGSPPNGIQPTDWKPAPSPCRGPKPCGKLTTEWA